MKSEDHLKWVLRNEVVLRTIGESERLTKLVLKTLHRAGRTDRP